MHRLPVALIRIAACAAVILLAGAGRADAAQCSISSTAVVFGTYNVFSSAPVDSTGTIVYKCNGGVRALLITMTKGQSSTFIPRALVKSKETLAYNLFRDAARTTVWGDFSGGTSAYIDVNPPNNQWVSLTVYGRISPGQDVSAGSYSDSVTVVVNF
jgi:spore coat protein U-like protein